MIPLNIPLMTNNPKRLQGLLPVATTDTYSVGDQGEFHEGGLFSSIIFGKPGTEQRNNRHGYIPMKIEVLHPKIYLELITLKKLYGGIMEGTDYAQWDAELKDFVKSDAVEGDTGYAFFMEHYKELVFKETKSLDRKAIIEMVNMYREQAPLKWLMVMPAGIRDLEVKEGKTTEHEVNELYRKVIRINNSINERFYMSNNPAMDRVRRLLQLNINAIWEMWMSFLSGKGGAMKSKYGSRTVQHATANVITAMDPAGIAVDSPRSYDITKTHFGIYQFIKGTELRMALHQMPNGIARDVIDNIGSQITVCDSKTGLPKEIVPSPEAVKNWGTEEGRMGLINLFKEEYYRHKPATVDGHPIAYIYEDAKGMRVVRNIKAIPPSMLRKKHRLAPMTWAEYFYLELMEYVEYTACDNVRYPAADEDSNYVSLPYVRSTVNAKLLKVYDDRWELTEKIYPEFPNTEENSEFFNTMSISPFFLDAVGGDHDGDRMGSIFSMSKEGRENILKRLYDKANWLKPNGDLKHSCGIETVERALRSFTGFTDY